MKMQTRTEQYPPTLMHCQYCKGRTRNWRTVAAELRFSPLASVDATNEDALDARN